MVIIGLRLTWSLGIHKLILKLGYVLDKDLMTNKSVKVDANYMLINNKGWIIIGKVMRS